MKKLMFLAPTLLILSLTACQSPSSDQAAGHEQQHSSEAVQPLHAGAIDPVCKMPREDSWTDYSVYNGDTTWFCSEFCKDAMAANPEKYLR